jgi:hypothetical protein
MAGLTRPSTYFEKTYECGRERSAFAAIYVMNCPPARTMDRRVKPGDDD